MSCLVFFEAFLMEFSETKYGLMYDTDQEIPTSVLVSESTK